jgi:hypothetical protein
VTRVSFTVCPFCGCEHELASFVADPDKTPATEPRLTPGCATMCIKCGEISVMDNSEMLRKPSQRDARKLKRDVRVQKLRAAWTDAVAKRKSS